MQLIPLCSIRVKRNGQSVTPQLNKAFEFTAEEKADLDKLTAETGQDYYRLPVNELPVETSTAETSTAETKVEPPVVQVDKPAKGAKTKAKADESL